MGSVTTLPRGRPFTRDDLDAMPEDGHRYELVDGTLVVTPAPSQLHQIVVGELYLRLRSGCPPDLRVLLSPFDVALDELSVLQPDLVVARGAELTARDLPAAPVLAIEVLSPSTRHIDLGLKRAKYESAGCQSFWVVDPQVPSLTAWLLQDGTFVEVAHVVGDEPFTATTPYPVELVPAELLD